MDSKILIVDDSPENLKLLGNSLKKNNFTVLTALNGRQALALAETKKPDLIILDVMMPEMDGFEVCEKLKSIKELENIPVMFLTALSQYETIKSGLEIGAVDYILKPFNIDYLILKINNQLKIKKQTDFSAKINETLSFLLNELNKQNVKSECEPFEAMALNETITNFIKKDLSYFSYCNSLFNLQSIRSIFDSFLNAPVSTNKFKYPKNFNFGLNYVGYGFLKYFFSSLHDLFKINGIKTYQINYQVEFKDETADLFIFDFIFETSQPNLDSVASIFNKFYNSQIVESNFSVLFLEKLLALLNGNFINISTEEKNVFRITLPICKKTDKTRLTESIEIEKNDFSSFKVLIVEDNELNQEYLKSIMQNFNLFFDIVESGEKAIEMAESKHYDLILMDVNLPGISGLETVSVLRRKLKVKQPIISISGHSEKEMVIKCLEAGFTGFLQKPFTQNDLEVILLKYLCNNNPIEPELKSNENDHDCSNAIELAAGNTEMLKQWLASFIDLLNQGKLIISELREKQEYIKGVKVFHDIINYSSYFKITKIIDFISELQNLKKESADYKITFNICLNLLEIEIISAKEYYTESLKGIK